MMAMPTLSVIGTAVEGYRIIAPLGVGATGAVYVAEDPLLGRRVAVKILHASRAEDEDAVRTFLGDAEAVRVLGHPLVASVLEVSCVATSAGALPCVIGELLPGRSVAEIVADDGPLAPARAVIIAEQVAKALVAAHATGLVHGSLKAENVFVTGGAAFLDEVKVLDFGTWRFRPPRGKAAYLSPEQCTDEEPDVRSDVYALGVLLFEMLTGALPYRVDGLGDLVIAHVSRSASRPSEIRPGVPTALDEIVARALERRPERRFSSMDGFLTALRDPSAYVPYSVDVEPVQAPAPTPAPAPVAAPAPEPRRPERRRAPVVLGLLAALSVGLVSVIVAATQRPIPKTAQAVAPAATVTLIVGSCVPDAHVFLNGVPAGRPGAPLHVLRDQPLDVAVRAPGYHPLTRRVIPRADLRVEMVLVPRPVGPSIL